MQHQHVSPMGCLLKQVPEPHAELRAWFRISGDTGEPNILTRPPGEFLCSTNVGITISRNIYLTKFIHTEERE